MKPRSGNVTQYLFFDNFVPFSSSVVERECLEEFGGFDESLKMGIDWDLWLRISTKYEFDFVNEPLLIYRLGHAGQMSKNVEERQRCSDRIMNGFVKRFPDKVNKTTLRRAWAYTYLNRGAYHADRSVSEALNYYCRAFLQWPFSLKPAMGILKVVRKRVV